MGHSGRIILIAGPNGAGKTSFFYQHNLVGEYIFVNADEIAKEIFLDKSLVQKYD